MAFAVCAQRISMHVAEHRVCTSPSQDGHLSIHLLQLIDLHVCF